MLIELTKQDIELILNALGDRNDYPAVSLGVRLMTALKSPNVSTGWTTWSMPENKRKEK